MKDKTIENLIFYCEVDEYAGCNGVYFNSSVIKESTQAELEEKCEFDSSDAYEGAIQVFDTIFDLSLLDDVNSLLGKDFKIDLDNDPYDTEHIIYVLAKFCAELEENPDSNGLNEIAIGQNWKILIDEQDDFNFEL